MEGSSAGSSVHPLMVQRIMDVKPCRGVLLGPREDEVCVMLS